MRITLNKEFLKIKLSKFLIKNINYIQKKKKIKLSDGILQVEQSVQITVDQVHKL